MHSTILFKTTYGIPFSLCYQFNHFLLANIRFPNLQSPPHRKLSFPCYCNLQYINSQYHQSHILIIPYHSYSPQLPQNTHPLTLPQ